MLWPGHIQRPTTVCVSATCSGRSNAGPCEGNKWYVQSHRHRHGETSHLRHLETDHATDGARGASRLFGNGAAVHHVYNVQPWVTMQAVKSAERALQFLAPFLPPAGSPLSIEPDSLTITSSAGPNVQMPSARMPFMNSLGANLPDQDVGRDSEAGPSRTEKGSVKEASAPYDVETRTCLLRSCKQFRKSFKNKDFWRHVKFTQDHKGQVGSAAGPTCSICGEVFSRDDSLGRHIRGKHGGSTEPSQ